MRQIERYTMSTKSESQLLQHVKRNAKAYLLLAGAFIAGVAAGAFSVNGLGTAQSAELTDYINGFLHLLDNHEAVGGDSLWVSVISSYKYIIALWVLGVTIIGAVLMLVVRSPHGN